MLVVAAVLNELVFGGKLLIDPVRRKLSFSMEMPRHFSRLGLDNYSIS